MLLETFGGLGPVAERVQEADSVDVLKRRELLGGPCCSGVASQSGANQTVSALSARPPKAAPGDVTTYQDRVRKK